MSFGYVNSGLRKMCALLLVGTMAGSASVSQVVCGQNVDNNTTYKNELLLGHYSDEDVKKNKEDIMLGIASNGKAKVKNYGKKNEVVPKTIRR